MKFYRCSTCEQIYTKLVDTDKPLSCCNELTEELPSNLIEDEVYNHVINIRKVGNFVTITINNHPMVDIHHVKFICMVTTKGYQYKELQLSEQPKAQFILSNDEQIKSVYTYCNLHSLWKTTV